MNPRSVWLFVCILALGVVAFGLGHSAAQKPADPAATPVYYGRFTVAYGSAERVILLDTATGQVYKAIERDFKAMADLPKAREATRSR